LTTRAGWWLARFRPPYDSRPPRQPLVTRDRKLAFFYHPMRPNSRATTVNRRSGFWPDRAFFFQFSSRGHVRASLPLETHNNDCKQRPSCAFLPSYHPALFLYGNRRGSFQNWIAPIGPTHEGIHFFFPGSRVESFLPPHGPIPSLKRRRFTRKAYLPGALLLVLCLHRNFTTGTSLVSTPANGRSRFPSLPVDKFDGLILGFLFSTPPLLRAEPFQTSLPLPQ